jgi:hypothetical protein
MPVQFWSAECLKWSIVTRAHVPRQAPSRRTAPASAKKLGTKRDSRDFVLWKKCGEDRVISDCHFAVQLNHFIPGFLSYSVAVFLKRQSDITLGEDDPWWASPWGPGRPGAPGALDRASPNLWGEPAWGQRSVFSVISYIAFSC